MAVTPLGRHHFNEQTVILRAVGVEGRERIPQPMLLRAATTDGSALLPLAEETAW